MRLINRILEKIVGQLLCLTFRHIILKDRCRRFKIVYDGEFYTVKERTFLFWRDLHETRTFMLLHRVPIVISALVKRNSYDEAADWLKRRYGHKARISANPLNE